MKVQKQGEEHKPKWLGCWRCPICDSEIVLEEGDDVDDMDDQRDGPMVAFHCPVCGNCSRDGEPPYAGRRNRAMPCIYASNRCRDTKP